jgi:hypothetical protein
MNGFLAGVGEYGSPRFLGVTLFVTPHLHQRRYQRVVALPDRFFVRFFGVALLDAFLSRLCCAFRFDPREDSADRTARSLRAWEEFH